MTLPLKSLLMLDHSCSFHHRLVTVKPVNKGHSRKKLHMVFIDKWALFGGYFVLFDQGRVIEM